MGQLSRRDALISELKFAGIYSAESNLKIRGHLKHVDFSSTKGEWIIELELKGPANESFTVSVLYDFAAGWVAVSACTNAANAFMPAVQGLIGAIIKDPEFRALVAP